MCCLIMRKLQRAFDLIHAFLLTAGSHQCRGVMQPPIEQLTSDGYDLQFGTNVLGEMSPSFSAFRCIVSYSMTYGLTSCFL